MGKKRTKSMQAQFGSKDTKVYSAIQWISKVIRLFPSFPTQAAAPVNVNRKMVLD